MVYVLDIEGNPLMPTERHGWVRRSLRDGKAKVARRSPFTIQLTYKQENELEEEATLGMDIGYTNVGVSVVTEEKEIFSGDFKLRTDIQERLATKRMYRRNRRSRKTRYRKARFLNRKKAHKDAPSIRQKVESHQRIIDLMCSIMPIGNLSIEIANFDPQKMQDPTIFGVGYQNGDQKGYENVKAYVRARDKHTCYFNQKKCSDKLEVHHIKFRSEGGSDAPKNLITLCEKCHKKLHDGKLSLPSNLKHKSLRSATFMNTVSCRLQELYPNVHYTYGYETKHERHQLGLEKSHSNDAFVIAGGNGQKRCETVKATFKRGNSRCLGKQRNGYAPSSRKQRYPIQPKDIIEYEGRRYSAIGTHNKGTRAMFKLNGKKKSVAVKKVKLIYNQRNIVFN